MNHTLLTLIRREFWENKSLWIAPLAMVGLIIGGATFAQVRSGPGNAFSVSPPALSDASRQAGAVSLTGVASVLAAVAAFVAFAYLLDCLFSERRDRSILFWKSLPVSDAQTVLAKLTVAMLVLPLGVILLALFTQPVVLIISWLRFEPLRVYINFGLFAAWPGTLVRLATVWAFTVLWYAPVAIYLMLASVLAKRAPLVYAFGPPLVLVMAEKLVLDTTHLLEFVGERVFPWQSRLPHLLETRDPSLLMGQRKLPGELHWWIPFQDLKLWAGLAVAAGMLYIVIRLRQFRDDT